MRASHSDQVGCCQRGWTNLCEADQTGILAVSNDTVSELCGSMAVAVPASQSGRYCGRVAVVEQAPQWRRLKLLGGSQDTTVGMPSNVSPVPWLRFEILHPICDVPQGRQFRSATHDCSSGHFNSQRRGSADQSMPDGRTTEMVCPRSRVKKRSSSRIGTR